MSQRSKANSRQSNPSQPAKQAQAQVSVSAPAVVNEVPLDIENLASLLEMRTEGEEVIPLARRLQKALVKLIDPRVNQIMKIAETLTSDKYDSTVKLREIQSKMTRQTDIGAFERLASQVVTLDQEVKTL